MKGKSTEFSVELELLSQQHVADTSKEMSRKNIEAELISVQTKLGSRNSSRIFDLLGNAAL